VFNHCTNSIKIHSTTMNRNSTYLLCTTNRGVARGRPGAIPPHWSWLSGFFNGKTGIVLSTRSVLWASNMPKCVGVQASAPDPTGGAHDSPQTPYSVGRGTFMPLTINTIATLLSSQSCAALLCPCLSDPAV